MRPSELGDPVAFSLGQVADGAPGSVESVRGVPAWVVPQNADEGLPGSVDIALSGVEVAILGDGDFSVEALRRTPESVT